MPIARNVALRRDFGITSNGLSNDAILDTEPVVVEVQPAPEGAPESFTGAVGQFDIRAELDRDQTQVDEPVTMKITVEGQGNISTASDPAWTERVSVVLAAGSSSELVQAASAIAATAAMLRASLLFMFSPSECFATDRQVRWGVESRQNVPVVEPAATLAAHPWLLRCVADGQQLRSVGARSRRDMPAEASELALSCGRHESVRQPVGSGCATAASTGHRGHRVARHRVQRGQGTG